MSEDGRFLCSEMFTGSLFYLWQLLLHLISSAVFEAFTKNNYSFHEMDLFYPPNRALIHIFPWQHPVVIRAVFTFAGLHSLGCYNFLGCGFVAWFTEVWGDCFQLFLWKHWGHWGLWEMEATWVFLFSAGSDANVDVPTVFSQEYKVLYWRPIDRQQLHCVTFQAVFSYCQDRLL